MARLSIDINAGKDCSDWHKANSSAYIVAPDRFLDDDNVLSSISNSQGNLVFVQSNNCPANSYYGYLKDSCVHRCADNGYPPNLAQVQNWRLAEGRASFPELKLLQKQNSNSYLKIYGDFHANATQID